MSPTLTEQSITVRISKALQVILLQEEGNTIEEACQAVGMSRSSFYEWVRKAPDMMDTVREHVGEQQRLLMVRLMVAWQRGLEELAEDLESKTLKTKDRVIALKLVRPILEDLLNTFHAQPGAEEAAHEFLKKGVTLQRQPSRMASLEVEPTETGGLKVHVSQYNDILDITPGQEAQKE